MDSYQQHLREETTYLEQTLAVIRNDLEAGAGSLSHMKGRIIASRKDLLENSSALPGDFSRLAEASQYLAEVGRQAAGYRLARQHLEKYQKMLDSPYFGRFDFQEGGAGREKIYLGLHTVMDPETGDVLVYDWRAPISGIFYRCEPGPASYSAPAGLISGEVLLKRQYKIKNSRLVHFFDCSLAITDELLQEILSRNASARMKNIVETIQKEQDLIIRDTENDLLLIQGVAGSGKTSIALHRIAYLLYQGLNSNLRSNNVILFSPNAVFSQYISGVLPELGEENVHQPTFDLLAEKAFAGRFAVETRAAQLEWLINAQGTEEDLTRKQSIDFKGSSTFAKILDRLIRHHDRRLLEFEDVYYHGIIIETKQQLKNRFLNNKFGLPTARQLQRLEKTIWEKVHPLQKKRLEKIQKIVTKSEGRDFEIKPFSRLLAIKEAKRLQSLLLKFTRVDYWQLYRLLFSRRDLFFRLARGLELPAKIEKIISGTRENIEKGRVGHEDCAPLLYLKLKTEGGGLFPEIRQVVIDEAQDYYPLHYHIFRLLFAGAKYTILGDLNQTMEKEADARLYDHISEILNRDHTLKLFLNKGYRSTCEISRFTQQLLGKKTDHASLLRHGEEPRVVRRESEELLYQALSRDAKDLLRQGCQSLAIICKTGQEAERVHSGLKDLLPVKLIQPRGGKLEKGVLVLPSYLAKGLEFDAVLVWGADRENYSSDLDRRLLYIACSRALHRLSVYHTGEKSPFLQ